MNNISKEDRLLKVLNNVNDWLKFAESKNTMLIAFNAASIFGISQLYQLEKVKSSDYLPQYLFFVIILLAFSAVIAMLSFVPRVKILKGGFYGRSTTPNCLFYEYLKGRSEVEIVQDVCETNEIKFSRFEIDIANQIQQNSNIASKKLSYFTIAIWLTVSAYITIPFAFIFLLFTYIDKTIDRN